MSKSTDWKEYYAAAGIAVAGSGAYMMYETSAYYSSGKVKFAYVLSATAIDIAFTGIALNHLGGEFTARDAGTLTGNVIGG